MVDGFVPDNNEGAGGGREKMVMCVPSIPVLRFHGLVRNCYLNDFEFMY